ncbi:hypothetical protein CY34DRAFT_811833 [Suillus luteus UH-Slu-Lm8-n1]|uniref:Uncharacterized protein n=1 Tax=Suillus luteus UH-Slu-Lm8-n1 TaxID=930992 RepID=A0A0D0AVF2_9AGAM|nr:hypothetical protein CY34DRAFT_811833 [Suillus luteus UH-Slu-Lm8-n1]
MPYFELTTPQMKWWSLKGRKVQAPWRVGEVPHKLRENERVLNASGTTVISDKTSTGRIGRR